MGKNRKFKLDSAEKLRSAFSETVTVIHKHLGNKAFKPVRALNAAVFDSVMIGVARRLQKGPIKNGDEFRKAYKSLLENQDFLDATLTATADELNVERRIRMSTETFQNVM